MPIPEMNMGRKHVAEHNPLCTPNDHLLSRRKLLGGLTAGAAGVMAYPSLGFSDLTRAAADGSVEKKHKQVLFVWIDGGMSQYESWDPKPNTEFGGPFSTLR